jgi:hypothetical protein
MANLASQVALSDAKNHYWLTQCVIAIEGAGKGPPKTAKTHQKEQARHALKLPFKTIKRPPLSRFAVMTARSPIKYEVIEDVPDIFEVIRVIERQGVRNYADLSEHSFTQLEKVFLCQELAKKRTDEALLMDSTDISKGHAVVTPKGVSERYNISRNTIEWWVKKYHHGEAFTDEERKGAPEALDATSLGVVSQRIVIAEQSSSTTCTRIPPHRSCISTKYLQRLSPLFFLRSRPMPRHLRTNDPLNLLSSHLNARQGVAIGLIIRIDRQL